MPARILHVSDLHVGAHGDDLRDTEGPLRALVGQLAPELVIASGDLTQRNRPEQHARAAALLRGLGPPLLTLPGNHDLPTFPPARVTRPFSAFLREWEELEPVYRSPAFVVCGLNSVLPWKYQRGALSKAQLARAAELLAGRGDGALRIVAVHHQLASAPWRTGKRPIARRTSVLSALERAGADLVVGGHTHQALVVERREFLAEDGALVLVTAAGLGRPRPGRRAEATGVHVIETEATRLRIETYALLGGRFELVAERLFARRS